MSSPIAIATATYAVSGQKSAEGVVVLDSCDEGPNGTPRGD
jgi:hypothetical protein